MNLPRSLHIILFGKIVQISAEFLSTLDIVPGKTQNSIVSMGEILVILTIYHVWIKATKDSLFLTSFYVLSYPIRIALEHYKQVSNDNALKKNQQICSITIRDS